MLPLHHRAADRPEQACSGRQASDHDLQNQPDRQVGQDPPGPAVFGPGVCRVDLHTDLCVGGGRPHVEDAGHACYKVCVSPGAAEDIVFSHCLGSMVH